MTRWILIGTVLQTAMVGVGHWVGAVSQLFGPLGMAISLLVGLLWARGAAVDGRQGATGGAIVGGACALIGIAISVALGDVTAVILLIGTVSSAVAGAIGGVIGARLGTRAAAAT